MSDPQQFGLGELGQRVQAMSDPARVPANPAPAPSQTANPISNPAAPSTSADPRLRPYQGAPPPIGSLSSRGPLPSYEPREDLRTAPPSPVPPQPPAASQFSPIAAPSPYPASAASQPFNQNSLRPFEPAPKSPPASAWEHVSVPPQPTPADPAQTAAESQYPDATTDSQPSGAASATPAAPVDPPKSGFQRAFDMIRSAIPVVQKLLPLLDGNFATTMGALMAPQHHPAQVDLEPVERGLAEVRNSNRELRTQVLEQGSTLKRVEDQLDRVREATDRNTLEQQELVEDLRAVGNRISTLAILGVFLLLLSLGLNGYLIFELQHILR